MNGMCSMNHPVYGLLPHFCPPYKIRIEDIQLELGHLPPVILPFSARNGENRVWALRARVNFIVI